MDFASFGNTLDMVAQRDSFARRRHSNALPMVICGGCDAGIQAGSEGSSTPEMIKAAV
jgi:hypothetical protein